MAWRGQSQDRAVLHVGGRDFDVRDAAVRFGYGTVVLQSGEDPAVSGEWVADVVRQIKHRTPLAVTLSLGEREPYELGAWRDAGGSLPAAFETSNPQLYSRIHPARPETTSDRRALLRQLRRIGYEIGSGVMIGIPGQTYDDLARDILLFAELDLDMVGVGPFLPHPQTPLAEPARAPRGGRRRPGSQRRTDDV